jgi:iron(III) transport system ATP-binding protein
VLGIRVENLSKSFGPNKALDDISFEVGDGELISMLGASGCGKTTTLRCIAGLERGETGRVHIHSHLVSDFARNHELSPDRRDIGMVFQSYAIWPHMTVFRNVAYPLVMRARPRAEIRQAVAQVLRMVGMEELAERSATKLSGGQQQRVALARALVARPRVLLFDEPLSNLDAKLRDQTRHELRQIQQNLGVTAVYVTHDQSEAMAISDRIIVMERGRIEQIGTPEEVYQRPASAFVADFVGSSNFLRLRRRPGAAGNGLIAGELENGQRILVPDAGLAGDVLLVSLRPQFCTVEPVAKKVPPERNQLTGTIVRSTFFGERSEALVDIGGTELLTYLPLGAPFRNEDRVKVTFAPEHCVPLQP